MRPACYSYPCASQRLALHYFPLSRSSASFAGSTSVAVEPRWVIRGFKTTNKDKVIHRSVVRTRQIKAVEGSAQSPRRRYIVNIR
jgi:hypothetical protein